MEEKEELFQDSANKFSLLSDCTKTAIVHFGALLELRYHGYKGDSGILVRLIANGNGFRQVGQAASNRN